MPGCNLGFYALTGFQFVIAMSRRRPSVFAVRIWFVIDVTRFVIRNYEVLIDAVNYIPKYINNI